MRVLVSPLDWGIGHATRLIPLVRECLACGAEVTLAADGAQARILEAVFPSVEILPLKGYGISYGGSSGFTSAMVKQLRQIHRSIKSEHAWLADLQKREKFDIVLSDNRYGLWVENAYNIFITHQLNIIPPKGLGWGKPMLDSYLKKLLGGYQEVWVPDTEGAGNLSGKLSANHGMHSNVHYIGPLSRFEHLETAADSAAVYDVVILLSGPEPQRTLLENILYGQLPLPGKRVLFGRGLVGPVSRLAPRDGTQIMDFVSPADLASAIDRNTIVVCRSGYSTVMDLAFLGCRAVFIPTPGQTEQEYLAQRLERPGLYATASQRNANLQGLINGLGNHSAEKSVNIVSNYKSHIQRIFL